MVLEFVSFIAIGFTAQLVDGALGMAYGVISMSVLLAMGIPPVTASAVIHTAEIFTTGISGLSHILYKNVDFSFFKWLVIPGIIGSIIGAYILTSLPAPVIKPLIAGYLLLMGIFILYLL